MDIVPENLDEQSKKLLTVFPVRNPNVEWYYRDGVAVIEYKKEFNRLERGLHKLLGGPEVIKRPLDKLGTPMWEMCDGKRSVLEICREMEGRFHEEIEPSVYRVWAFMQLLLDRNLVYLEKAPQEGEASRPKEVDEDEAPPQEA